MTWALIAISSMTLFLECLPHRWKEPAACLLWLALLVNRTQSAIPREGNVSEKLSRLDWHLRDSLELIEVIRIMSCPGKRGAKD